MNEEPIIVFPPATRARDNAASHRAEAKQDKHHDAKRVLLGFYAHPTTTTKELSGLTGLDRYMVARRAPDLWRNGYLDRVDGNDGWRWTLTAKGLAEVSRQNGFNPPGRR